MGIPLHSIPYLLPQALTAINNTPMINRLFVYGTLAPGQSNEHVLAAVQGRWEPATVKGTFFKESWGAAAGYPGVILDKEGTEIKGLIFSSDELPRHWERLDQFEGDGYRRVITSAHLEDGTGLKTYIYELNTSV